MPVDANAGIYMRHAQEIAETMSNGNLTIGIDMLFANEDPVVNVAVALHLVAFLSNQNRKPTTDVTDKLIGLITVWSHC